MLALFLSYLLLYKYLILFTIAFSASVILPLPAAAVLMAAGAFASQGYLDFNFVILAALLGNLLGDSLSYFLSFRFGRDFLMSIGLKKILASKQFTFIERRFLAHDLATVFFSRWLVPALGTTVNLLSGLYKVPLKHFLLCIISGEIIYVVSFASLGYFFGAEWEELLSIVQNLYTIGALTSLLGLTILFYFRKRRRKRLLAIN